MTKRWLVVLGVLVLAALLLGGCQNQPTVEEIVAKVREVEASTDDAHGVVEVRINALGEDEDSVVEVWEKRPNKTRIEVVESSDPEFGGAIIVADGHHVWVYFPTENRVVIGEVGSDEPAGPREMIQFMEEIIQKMLDTSEIKLMGEEDVSGIATYKLELTPKEGEESVLPAGSTATVWVDQERWVVLRAHFIGDVVGEAWMSVRSFELNAGLADDLFQFEVPEGAEVVSMESREPVPLTLDEAKAQADFLLLPTYVPEGVTLINVFSVDGVIVLHYDHSTTSFTIMQGSAPTMEEIPIGETIEVTVRGQRATLITEEVLGTSFLTWQENGVTIAIAGRISQEETLQVAESLQ
jgi:outer membrane lipoprotein-sorting protein